MSAWYPRPVKPTFRDLPELCAVGARVVGHPAELGALVPEAWTRLRGTLADRFATDRQVGFQVPGDLFEPDDHIVTYIGIPVSAEVETPKGLLKATWPAMRYAEFRYVGSFLDSAFVEFYPAIFAAIERDGLQPHPDHGWQEHYDDATHDWADKTYPGNTLVVRIPLAG